MTNTLRVENITKSFGELKALDGISLNVEDKSVTILIGPNGSGKTTLLNVIAGFHVPDEGKIFFGDRDITHIRPHLIYRLGVARTFQIPALFWKLTVLENLLVGDKDNKGESFTRFVFRRWWENSETKAVEKASRILDLLGLKEKWDQPAYNLSGGQMKLVEIGRVLMTDAKLLLLDEPVSGVNPTLAHEIFARLLQLRDELGITFLIVEHRLDIALGYVDYIHAMAFGQVIASGVPEKVMVDPKVIEAYLGG